MNSKEEQTNSEVNNLENESFIEQQKDRNYINEQIGEVVILEKTNGRFAMIGFLSIILIELFSKQSFLKWAGIL